MEVVAVAAGAIDTGRVRIAGDDMRVDAVVAAPGLSLDSVAAGGEVISRLSPPGIYPQPRRRHRR